jgi:hypothetical protein
MEENENYKEGYPNTSRSAPATKFEQVIGAAEDSKNKRLPTLGSITQRSPTHREKSIQGNPMAQSQSHFRVVSSRDRIYRPREEKLQKVPAVDVNTLTSAFVSSVDILSKMKNLSHQRQVSGKVLHSYRANLHQRPTLQPMSLAASIPLTPSNLALNSSHDKTLASRAIDATAMRMELKREELSLAKRGVHRGEQLVQSNASALSNQNQGSIPGLEGNSEVYVSDPLGLSQIPPLSTKLLKQQKPRLALHPTPQGQPQDPILALPDKNYGKISRFLPPRLNTQESVDQSVQGTSHQMEQSMSGLVDYPDDDCITALGIMDRDVHRKEHSGSVNSLQRVMITNKDIFRQREEEYRRKRKAARTSVLMRVDGINQIDKRELAEHEPEDIYYRTCGKLGNLVTQQNEYLFEGFMEEFERISRVFEEFRVKDLGDYNLHPIEPFDLELDQTTDIEYRLQRNNKGLSRWATMDGELTWRPCTILEYHKEEDRFLIRWEGSDVLKNVTRMNLLFDGEVPQEFENRRLRANVVRSFYLMEKSFRDILLSKDLLQKNKIYFSFEIFKKILQLSGLSPEMYNTTNALPGFWQEIIDDYAITIMKFYVDFKTAYSYDEFVAKCAKEITERAFSKPMPSSEVYAFHEHVAISMNPDDPTVHRAEEVIRWERPNIIEEYNFVEDNRVKIPINRVLLLNAIDGKNSRLLLDVEASEKVFSAQEGQDKVEGTNLEIKEMAKSVHSEEKSTTSNKLKMIGSPLPSPEPSMITALPLVTKKKAPEPITKVLYRCRVQLPTTGNPNPKIHVKHICDSIMSLTTMIVNSMVTPHMDIYIGSMALFKSTIQEMEDYNIFCSVTEHLEAGGEVETIDMDSVNKILEKIKYLVEVVQSHLSSMREDFFVLAEQRKKAAVMEKMKCLVGILNQEVTNSVNKLVVNSSKSLIKLSRFLLSSLTVGEEYQRRLDILLSKNNYFQRCIGLVDRKLLPKGMEEYPHPNKLVCKVQSEFRRRCLVIKTFVSFLMKMIQNGSLVYNPR